MIFSPNSPNFAKQYLFIFFFTVPEMLLTKFSSGFPCMWITYKQILPIQMLSFLFFHGWPYRWHYAPSTQFNTVNAKIQIDNRKFEPDRADKHSMMFSAFFPCLSTISFTHPSYSFVPPKLITSSLPCQNETFLMTKGKIAKEGWYLSFKPGENVILHKVKFQQMVSTLKFFKSCVCKYKWQKCFSFLWRGIAHFDFVQYCMYAR